MALAASVVLGLLIVVGDGARRAAPPRLGGGVLSADRARPDRSASPTRPPGGRRRGPRPADRRGAGRARPVRVGQVDAAARGRRAGDARPPARSRGTAATSPTVPTHRRGFALMFQDGQLFPHQSVAGNVGYPLRLRRTPRGAGPHAGRGAARAGRAARLRLPQHHRACRVASGSASLWPARSRWTRGCCSSTSRSRRSTAGCASGSPATCATSSSPPVRRPCSSPTTTRRRSRSRTGWP